MFLVIILEPKILRKIIYFSILFFLTALFFKLILFTVDNTSHIPVFGISVKPEPIMYNAALIM